MVVNIFILNNNLPHEVTPLDRKTRPYGATYCNVCALLINARHFRPYSDTTALPQIVCVHSLRLHETFFTRVPALSTWPKPDGHMKSITRNLAMTVPLVWPKPGGPILSAYPVRNWSRHEGIPGRADSDSQYSECWCQFRWNQARISP